MKDIHATAVADEVRELHLHSIRPIRFWFHPRQKAIHCSLVAGLDYDVVLGKPWPPRCPRCGVGINRRGADRNFQATGCRQDAAQQNRSLLPVVIAESINNKHANLVFSGIGRDAPDTGEQHSELAKDSADLHASMISARGSGIPRPNRAVGGWPRSSCFSQTTTEGGPGA